MPAAECVDFWTTKGRKSTGSGAAVSPAERDHLIRSAAWVRAAAE